MSDHLFQRAGRSRAWYATYYDADGKRHTRSTRQLDKRAAAATLREWERREADPAYTSAHQAAATLGEALAGLIRDRRLKGRAEGTIDCYRVKAGHIARLMGASTPVRTIHARVVDAYVDRRLDEGASRNTVHKELTVLRGTLKVAKRRGEFPGDIDAVMPDGFSPEYKPRETFLTAPAARALLAQLEPDRTARVAFLIATGARWGESDRARRVDVDLRLGIVRLRGTKTKTSERRVPVVGFAAPLLEHCLAHCAGSDGLLFTPWLNVRRDLAAACKRAGIPAVTPNDLRRTCGTWWRQLEVEPHLIGSLLGHGDSRMVERVYGRIPAESLGRALERRLPAPTPEDSTAGAANPGDTAARKRRQRQSEAGQVSETTVSEDGIEPPTRGFSIPALLPVSGRNHKPKSRGAA